MQSLGAVKLKDGSLEIVLGTRREKAARMAGIQPSVKVLGTEDEIGGEKGKVLLAISENIVRRNFSPIEEGRAYKLALEVGATLTELMALLEAGGVPSSEAHIRNRIRLLSLPPKVQDIVHEGQISLFHALELLPLSHPEAQTRLAKKVADEQLSREELTGITQKLNENRILALSELPHGTCRGCGEGIELTLVSKELAKCNSCKAQWNPTTGELIVPPKQDPPAPQGNSEEVKVGEPLVYRSRLCLEDWIGYFSSMPISRVTVSGKRVTFRFKKPLNIANTIIEAHNFRSGEKTRLLTRGDSEAMIRELEKKIKK